MILPNRMNIKFEGQYVNEHFRYESYRSIETLKRHRFTLSKIFQRRHQRLMYKYPCFSFEKGEDLLAAQKANKPLFSFHDETETCYECPEWTAEMQAELDRENLSESKLRELGVFMTDTAFIFGENQLGV